MLNGFMAYLVDVVQDAAVYGQFQHVLNIQTGKYGELAATATERVVVADVIILCQQAAAHILVKVTVLVQDVHIEYVQAAYIDV